MLNFLIGLAILAIIAAIVFFFLWSGEDALPQGTAGGKPVKPGGGGTSQVQAGFTAPPTVVTVGQQATFNFDSKLYSATSGNTTPIKGRGFFFSVQPQEARIVPINGNPVGGSTAQGETDAKGRIAVVVTVNSLPADPEGVLVGGRTANITSATAHKAPFEITK
jgi:hypothetical protein